MAEENGDKTEAPTARKREEARDQGMVARSTDLTSAAMLVGGLVLLRQFGGKIIASLKAMVEVSLGNRSLSDVRVGSATDNLTTQLAPVASSLMPMLIGLILLAIIVNIAQVGFRVTPEKLMPDIGALNPLKGLGNLFKPQSFVRLLMGVLKMMLVGMTAYSAIHSRLGLIIGVENLSFEQMFWMGGDLIYSIGMRVGILLLILALIDWVYQKFQFERNLRMTKQEVKDEMRNMDGDPKIKMRRRQIAQQIAQKKLKKDVPTADVVITNPTEYAIALKYDSTLMHAPRVVAKGRDLIAKRIRELAIEAGVPILERKPLARALYKLVEVGQEIPEEFYSAVAEILAYVYELTGKARREKAAATAR